jgi:hypothetical protein
MIGDTQPELRRSMNAAESAGKNPVFTSVTAGGHVYVFSPYAQILRAKDALLVRAYSQIFLFPITGTVVKYGGAEVRIDDLPAIVLPAGWYDRQSATGVFEEDASQHAATTDAWNGLKDPWQTGAVLTPWTKGAANDAQSVQDLKP